MSVVLCQKAQIKLLNTIRFTAKNQSLYTIGKPEGEDRARLIVEGSQLATAIRGTCHRCDHLYLGHLEIDGGRPALGRIIENSAGHALIELGGDSNGQIIEFVRAYEPRGWTILHAQEGSRPGSITSCHSLTIRNNNLGPAGYSGGLEPVELLRPNNHFSNHTKSDLKSLKKLINHRGWADAISMACPESLVQGNYIFDATDGAIVIFGAPGSRISENTIVAQDRDLLGGINMVDFHPFNGNYTGVIVENNHLHAEGAMIKVGIAMGTKVWWDFRKSTLGRNFNGLVRQNKFSTSKDRGYFGYGIAISGFDSTQIYSNVFKSNSRFDGYLNPKCKHNYLTPIPTHLTYDPKTTSNLKVQNDSIPGQVTYLLCIGSLSEKKSSSS